MLEEEITQDDFIPQYVDIPKPGEENTFSYPAIICWTTSAPIRYGILQASATVLQRRDSADDEWTFIPSLNVSCSSETDDDNLDWNPFADDSVINLPSEKRFDFAIDAIYDKLDDIIYKYGL